MGKLRFTLTNIMFWVIMLMVIFLSEFFQLYASQTMSVSDTTTVFLLSFLIIDLMVFYYIVEHKKNQMKIDWILLPSLIIFSGLMIWTIYRQGDRTFSNGNEVTFTSIEKFSYSIQVLIWMSSLYMLVYIHNRFGFNNTFSKLVAKIVLLTVLACIVIDFIYEHDIYLAIMAGNFDNDGTSFLIYNRNVWGMILLVGLLSGLVLLQDKFNWFYFISIFFIYFAILFVKCTSVTLIGFFVCLLTGIYELISHFRHQKKKLFLILGISVIAIAIWITLSTVLADNNIPPFSFVKNYFNLIISGKDYLTFSGRTPIWEHIIELLKENALDLWFGLGYRTGNKILGASFSYGEILRSAHNGVMEIFLRHGLIGAGIYFIVGLVSFLSFITYIRHKAYRKAFVYAISFAALAAHDFVESTTIFTPNLQGALLTSIFILPLLNTVKQKKFDVLKNDLLALELNDFDPKTNNISNIGTYIGLGIAISCISLAALNNMFIYIGLLTAVLVVVLVIVNKFINKFSFKTFFRQTIVAATSSLILGLIVSLIIKQSFVINLFYSILLVTLIMVIYLILLILCNKKSNDYLKIFNDYGLFFYKRMINEGDYR